MKHGLRLLQEGTGGAAVEEVGEETRVAEGDMGELRKRGGGDIGVADGGNGSDGGECTSRQQCPFFHTRAVDLANGVGLENECPQDLGNESEMITQRGVRCQLGIVDRVQEEMAKESAVGGGERSEGIVRSRERVGSHVLDTSSSFFGLSRRWAP